MGVIITKKNVFLLFAVVTILAVQGAQGQAPTHKCCKDAACADGTTIDTCEACLLKEGVPHADGCAAAGAAVGCDDTAKTCICKKDNCNKDETACHTEAKCPVAGGTSAQPPTTDAPEASSVNGILSSPLILAASVILSGYVAKPSILRKSTGLF